MSLPSSVVSPASGVLAEPSESLPSPAVSPEAASVLLSISFWAIASVAGKGFLVMLPARVISNLALLPVDVFLLALFLPSVLRTYNTVFKGVRKVKENAVFTDSGFATALMYIVCLLLVIMCCVGLSEQDLKTKNSDLKKTVAAQSETIERMQSEIDKLYENAEIGRAHV